MPVGDVNSDAPGSGARFNDGKTRYDLIPLEDLKGLANVLEHGAKKYAPWNWTKGMAWSVPFGCLMRHLWKWQMGERVDAESGESHLDHAMANLLMLVHYEKFYPEGDDRPPVKFFGKKET